MRRSDASEAASDAASEPASEAAPEAGSEAGAAAPTGADVESERARIRGALAVTPALAALPAEDRATIAGFLRPLSFAAGEVVVEQGATDRSMYFVVDGEGRIRAGDVDLGPVRRGDHVGELGLVLGRPRAATIRADGPLEVAELSLEGFERLVEEHPRLGLRLSRALLSGVASRLADVTASLGLLLHERSLPRRSHVRVRVRGRLTEVRTGTAAGQLLPAEVDGRPVVAALLDRKAASLTTPLLSESSLDALTVAHWEGQRVIRASLALALAEAAGRLDPPARVELHHSLGFGQRVRVIDAGGRDPLTLAGALEQQMQSLVEERAPLREELWTVDEARAHFAAIGWPDVADLLATWRHPAIQLATYGRVYALALEPFLPSTDRLGPSTMTGLEDDCLLLLYGEDAASRPAPDAHEPLPDPSASARIRLTRRTGAALGEQERWLSALGVTSVGAFNGTCIRGDVARLIQVAEGFHEKRLGAIADAIADPSRACRVVCVAGPSSSGKTTFIKRLKTQLLVNGVNPIGISLDDYYVDRDLTPRDAHGDFDFEALEAIDLDLFHDHLGRLLRGEQVATSRFDFVSGRSVPAGGPVLRLSAGCVLLLEGIHGLNPRLFGRLEAPSVYRVFVCPLAQLPFDRVMRVRASDARLLRRIVRDRHGRGHDAAATILRWPSVRRGERRHIFPFHDRADATFDSTLVYELAVLKVFAERYLLEVPRDHPAFTTAFRLLRLLDGFVTIYPDHVPQTSILREFIGGSGFDG